MRFAGNASPGLLVLPAAPTHGFLRVQRHRQMVLERGQRLGDEGRDVRVGVRLVLLKVALCRG